MLKTFKDIRKSVPDSLNLQKIRLQIADIEYLSHQIQGLTDRTYNQYTPTAQTKQKQHIEGRQRINTVNQSLMIGKYNTKKTTDVKKLLSKREKEKIVGRLNGIIEILNNNDISIAYMEDIIQIINSLQLKLSRK